MIRVLRITGWLSLVVSLLLSTLTGCGRSFYKVSGEVTYKGKAVPKGTISFLPKEKGVRPVASAIENGKYTIPQAPAGEMTVTISTPPPPPEPEKGKKPPPRFKPKEKPKEDMNVPAKYGDRKTTPLTYTVTSGEQTKNFELQP